MCGLRGNGGIYFWWLWRKIIQRYSLWVNPLQPRDAKWWHRSGSTLAWVLAFYLMAPSHYPSHLSAVIPSEIHLKANSHEIPQPLNTKTSLKIIYVKFHSTIPWASELKSDLCSALTHWGRVTHICVGKLNSIGSDNGLSPERRQAIIWTNAEILLIGPLGTNFSEILIEIQIFSLKKIRLKMSSAKCCSFRLGLNVLRSFSAGCFIVLYWIMLYWMYHQTSNIRCTKAQTCFSSCSCLCPIHWSQLLREEWRCSWSSSDRRCSNYIWVMNNFIA